MHLPITLPLTLFQVSPGLANERPTVWGLGLVAVPISMIMSLATRWAGRGQQ